MKKIDRLIYKKIHEYSPGGRLEHTANYYLVLYEIQQLDTKYHCERVALSAEELALAVGDDAKAAFFAGLLHDVGKLDFPSKYFDGRNISDEEYERLKKHAIAGFQKLKKLHYFTALCAGLHHSLCKHGYGLTQNDFPKSWNVNTIKKVLRISTIVSICDYIDASNSRGTKVKSEASDNGRPLKERLKEKYPGESGPCSPGR